MRKKMKNVIIEVILVFPILSFSAFIVKLIPFFPNINGIIKILILAGIAFGIIKFFGILIFGKYIDVDNDSFDTLVAFDEKVKRSTQVYKKIQRALIMMSILFFIAGILATIYGIVYGTNNKPHNSQFWINFISLLASGLTIFSVGITIGALAEASGENIYTRKRDQLWFIQQFNELKHSKSSDTINPVISPVPKEISKANKQKESTKKKKRRKKK